MKKNEDGSIEHYDENGNYIYCKYIDEYEGWYEEWYEYDENNNCIHFKNTDGYEFFYINNALVTKTEWEKYYNK